MSQNHTDTINRQLRHTPFFVTDKSVFKEIKREITYEVLNLLLLEWIAVVKLAEKLKKFNIPCLDIEKDICKLECILPIQFGLPCKCFFYQCLIRGKPITLSLIHLYWFLDGPQYIPKNGWQIIYSDCQFENQMLEDFQEKKMPSNCYQKYRMVL